MLFMYWVSLYLALYAALFQEARYLCGVNLTNGTLLVFQDRIVLVRAAWIPF
jgi:hypothetical protein